LQLHPNVVGVGEIEFLCVAPQADVSANARRSQLAYDFIRVEVFQPKTHMVDTQGAVLSGIDTEKAGADLQIDTRILTGQQLDLFPSQSEAVSATSKLVGTNRKSAVSAKRAHNGVMTQRFLS
jgi:hypothetical protein